MRLDERDSQIAAAAIQLLEREYAERLESHPDARRSFEYRYGGDERAAFDEHNRITHVVRKLATGGEHDLFDWETEIVRTSLQRYEAALSDATALAAHIADERSQYIATDEQRQFELERTQALLRKF
jgi:hypothetical protein